MVKVLVGSSPGGLVSFCSQAFVGSASDRQISESTALVILCDPRDSIMAYKGFNVQDMFTPFNITINIPTFFKTKNRLTGQVVIRDRKIANKKVYIERIIGLAKTYKIPRKPINNAESALATEITNVCFMLCKFKCDIVSKYTSVVTSLHVITYTSNLQLAVYI